MAAVQSFDIWVKVIVGPFHTVALSAGTAAKTSTAYSATPELRRSQPEEPILICGMISNVRVACQQHSSGHGWIHEKPSFLWRAFRYEGDSSGVKRLDLLFIPSKNGALNR